MATQKDIANYLSITQQAVSLAFNKPDQVSPEMRDKVLKAAKDLGYRLNLAARATKKQCFENVAMICDTLTMRSSLPPEVLNGSMEALNRINYGFSMAKLPDQRLLDERFMPRILSHLMADGLLLNLHGRMPTKVSELVKDHNIPVTWINNKRKSDSVYPDDFGAAYHLSQHLMKAGAKQIAYWDFVYHIKQPHYSKVDRKEGYEKAMQDAGKEPITFLPKKLNFHDGYIQIRNWFEANPTVDAVIGYGSRETNLLVAEYFPKLKPDNPVFVGTFAFPYTEEALPFFRMEIPHFAIGERAVAQLHHKIVSGTTQMPSEVVPFTYNPGEPMRYA